MSLALSESDKERLRYHLGFFNVDPASAIALGFPAGIETQFLLERASNKINSASAVARVQKILAIMDAIESQMVDALSRLTAIQVDEVKIRGSRDERVEQDELEDEYIRWGHRLADQLGVMINAATRRYRKGSMNVRVVNGC
ncbi:MAG: hypothetical protein EPN91_00840 [Salinibacterium sp.]|nr:MAG: hypothetical protein EPN91_00840 [Salinibacterium sp.]